MIENRQKKERLSLINRRNLRYDNYTRSLVTEAVRVNMLPLTVADDLQMQIMGQLETLLKENEQELNEEELLTSVFFTLDAYLMGYHDPMYAIAALQSHDVGEMFRSGQKQLRERICDSVALYVQAKRNRQRIENDYYNHTLDKEIKDALRRYDIYHAAHSIALKMSYPLAFERAEYRGVYYIKHYLKQMITEDRICGCFPAPERDALYASYAQQNHKELKSCRMNLFSVVMNQALGNALLGKYTGELRHTVKEGKSLLKKLREMSGYELQETVRRNVQQLSLDLHLELEQQNYLTAYGRRYRQQIQNVQSENMLREFFVAD